MVGEGGAGRFTTKARRTQRAEWSEKAEPEGLTTKARRTQRAEWPEKAEPEGLTTKARRTRRAEWPEKAEPEGSHQPRFAARTVSRRLSETPSRGSRGLDTGLAANLG